MVVPPELVICPVVRQEDLCPLRGARERESERERVSVRVSEREREREREFFVDNLLVRVLHID